jgi:hypothetical protein
MKNETWQRALCILFCLATGIFAPATAELSPPLKEACNSVWRLQNWIFQPDKTDEGTRKNWADPEFVDRNWQKMEPYKTWQDQGHKDFHGTGWYRLHIDVPADWKGSKVIFHSEGIREEYDLFVNGRLIRHFGSMKIPVGDVPTQAEIGAFLSYGRENVLALKVNDQGKSGGVWRRVLLRRVPDMSAYKHLLPSPVSDAHGKLVDLYWKTWQMAWEKVSFGNADNGFVPAYMEEGYNEQIFQWDSVFISMYGRYGRRLFPAMPTLDNFYVKQEADGYIQRIYSKTNGKKLLELNPKLTMTNPPLFAWSEWDYYKITGDSSRLPRVFPVLERYFSWIKSHQSSKLVPGMYWQTDWETGMDNMPRPNMEQAGCIDMTLQQALAAKYLSLIAGKLGEPAKEQFWHREWETLRDTVNSTAWSESDGIYYDVDRAKHFTGVKQIGAFWSLISGVATKKQAERLLAHLKDPKEFYRRHLFPALSASDPNYTREASYWAGGVWAPTDYMTTKGLSEYGFDEFAREAALNHLNNMRAVYDSDIDKTHIDPNETNGNYHTIWECYNPDRTCPCTRADKYYFGRQDFAGWTGIGPISLLIENVIGLNIVGSENRVDWNLAEQGRVGLENFELGADNIVSLVADRQARGKRLITVTADKPFRLVIRLNGKQADLKIPPGKSQHEL